MNTRLLAFILLFGAQCLLNAQVTQPVSPTNQMVTGNTDIRFAWNPLQGATVQYQLQCAQDSLFATLIHDTAGLTKNGVSLSVPLGFTYWWRVRVIVSGVPQSWSEAFKFTTWSPALFPGIKAWLETDTGMTLNGNQVQGWQSRVGTYALNQTDPNRRPLAADTMLLRKMGIMLDGTDDFLQGPFLNHSGLTIVLLHNPLNKNSSLFTQARFSFTGFNWHINNASRPGFSCLETPSNLGYSFFGHTYPFVIPTPRLTIDAITLRNQSQTLYTGLSDSTSNQTITFLDNPTLTFSRLGAMGNNSSYYKGNVYALIIADSAVNSTDYKQLNDYLMWKYQPPVNLGPDLHLGYNLCPFILEPAHHYASYLWSTGATSRSIAASNAGTYWLQTIDFFGRVSRDTLILTGQKPVVNINDTIICLHDTVIYTPGLGSGYSYLWNNDPLLNQPTLPVSTQGWVRLAVSDTTGCIVTDSATVIIDSYKLIATLGPDKSMCIGETLGLTAGAALTAAYQWSTGVSDTLPVIVVAGPGSYGVTTTNQRGCVATDQINITLKGISPVAQFSVASSPLCLGDTVWVNDLSTSGLSDPISGWLWNAGDNTLYTSQGPVGHAYATPGTYLFRLKVTTDSGCFNTYTDTITVLPLPPVAISPTTACSGTPALFHHSATGNPQPVSWLWTFHSQAPIPHTDTSASPSFTWAAPGIYPVTLSVTAASGCVNSGTFNITVNQSPVASITTPHNPVCDGTIVQFTENGVTHPAFPNQYWFWFFDDGTPATPVFTSSIAHEFLQPGQFTVSVVTGSLLSGCKDSTAMVFQVKHLPVAKVTTTDLCEGQIQQLIEASTIIGDTISQWIWNIQGHGVLAGKQPAMVFNDTGNFQVSLVVMTLSGCSDTTTTVFSVHATPEAKFSLTPIYGNPPLEVSFTNLSTKAKQYLWDFGDGNTSTLEHPKHTFTQPGIFDITLTATGDKGCATSFGSKAYTLQPAIDLEIIKIEGTIEGEWVIPVIELRNNSPMEIHKVEIEVWLSGGSPIREIWIPKSNADKLIPGFTKRIPLSAHLFAPAENPELRQIICAKAIIPEFPSDMNPDNNHQCSPIYRTFVVKDPWPNPTSVLANFDIIVDYPDDLTIDVFNIHGQSMGRIFEKYLEDGLTRISMPIPAELRSGVYILVFRYRDHVIMKRLIIQ